MGSGTPPVTYPNGWLYIYPGMEKHLHLQRKKASQHLFSGHAKIISLLLLALVCACQRWEKPASLLPAETRKDSVLSDPNLLDALMLTSRESVKEFYKSTENRLFWSVGGRMTSWSDSLLEVVRNADRWGLNPDEYHVRELNRILADSLFFEQLSRLDILLTDAYLTFYQHLRSGRLDPRSLLRRDISKTPDGEAIASLQKLRGSSLFAEIKSIEPAALPYVLLKEALMAYGGAEGDTITQRRRETIILNLERWRWAKQWPDRYIYVNIPAFRLKAVEGDSVWLNTAVVVGKRETPTPVLESVIRSFIIYPYWHVPHSISTREILPLLQADASYLHRNNFEVLDQRGRLVNADTLQWDDYGAGKFPFVLRQREGSENTMGIIKFNFANNYNVYLHDTSAKGLFRRSRRDFSHGCVRVQHAVSLAHYLVRDDDIYVSPEDLDQYLSFQQRHTIDLRKPIALKLQYFTAEVENGVTLFYDDIYKKDSLMLNALSGAPPLSLPEHSIF